MAQPTSWLRIMEEELGQKIHQVQLSQENDTAEGKESDIDIDIGQESQESNTLTKDEEIREKLRMVESLMLEANEYSGLAQHRNWEALQRLKEMTLEENTTQNRTTPLHSPPPTQYAQREQLKTPPGLQRPPYQTGYAFPGNPESSWDWVFDRYAVQATVEGPANSDSYHRELTSWATPAESVQNPNNHHSQKEKAAEGGQTGNRLLINKSTHEIGKRSDAEVEAEALQQTAKVANSVASTFLSKQPYIPVSISGEKHLVTATPARRYSAGSLLRSPSVSLQPQSRESEFNELSSFKGNSKPAPQLTWSFRFPFAEEQWQGTLSGYLQDAMRSLRIPGHAKNETIRVAFACTSDQFSQWIVTTLSEFGYSGQIATVHEGQENWKRVEQATSFLKQSKSILVCTTRFLDQFLKGYPRQIHILGLRAPNKPHKIPLNSSKALVARCLEFPLKESIAIIVVFSADERTIARGMANRLKTLGGQCVTPLTEIEKHFPKIGDASGRLLAGYSAIE